MYPVILNILSFGREDLTAHALILSYGYSVSSEMPFYDLVYHETFTVKMYQVSIEMFI